MQKSMFRLISVADIVSLINACFGFLAILILFSDIITPNELRIRVSFSFILLAILSDGLDGIIARKTRHSEIGEYLESMGDMTSLGIAPALFIYNTYHGEISWCPYYHSYLIIALILFLVMSITRLASFHIMKKEKFFIGLPASASTMILLTLAFLGVGYFFILPIIVVVSFALVSNVRFPKPGAKIDAIAALLIIITLIMGNTYYGFAPMVLLIAIILYSLGGPFYLWKSKK